MYSTNTERRFVKSFLQQFDKLIHIPFSDHESLQLQLEFVQYENNVFAMEREGSIHADPSPADDIIEVSSVEDGELFNDDNPLPISEQLQVKEEPKTFSDIEDLSLNNLLNENSDIPNNENDATDLKSLELSPIKSIELSPVNSSNSDHNDSAFLSDLLDSTFGCNKTAEVDRRLSESSNLSNLATSTASSSLISEINATKKILRYSEGVLSQSSLQTITNSGKVETIKPSTTLSPVSSVELTFQNNVSSETEKAKEPVASTSSMLSPLKMIKNDKIKGERDDRDATNDAAKQEKIKKRGFSAELLKSTIEYYQENAEHHRSYQREWSGFWHHRREQLKKANVDPSTYDYGNEWHEHWKVRVVQLILQEFEIDFHQLQVIRNQLKQSSSQSCFELDKYGKKRSSRSSSRRKRSRSSSRGRKRHSESSSDLDKFRKRRITRSPSRRRLSRSSSRGRKRSSRSISEKFRKRQFSRSCSRKRKSQSSSRERKSSSRSISEKFRKRQPSRSCSRKRKSRSSSRGRTRRSGSSSNLDRICSGRRSRSFSRKRKSPSPFGVRKRRLSRSVSRGRNRHSRSSSDLEKSRKKRRSRSPYRKRTSRSHSRERMKRVRSRSRKRAKRSRRRNSSKNRSSPKSRSTRKRSSSLSPPTAIRPESNSKSPLRMPTITNKNVPRSGKKPKIKRRHSTFRSSSPRNTKPKRSPDNKSAGPSITNISPRREPPRRRPSMYYAKPKSPQRQSTDSEYRRICISPIQSASTSTYRDRKTTDNQFKNQIPPRSTSCSTNKSKNMESTKYVVESPTKSPVSGDFFINNPSTSARPLPKQDSNRIQLPKKYNVSTILNNNLPHVTKQATSNLKDFPSNAPSTNYRNKKINCIEISSNSDESKGNSPTVDKVTATGPSARQHSLPRVPSPPKLQHSENMLGVIDLTADDTKQNHPIKLMKREEIAALISRKLKEQGIDADRCGEQVFRQHVAIQYKALKKSLKKHHEN